MNNVRFLRKMVAKQQKIIGFLPRINNVSLLLNLAWKVEGYGWKLLEITL